MLTIFGKQYRNCDGISRRDFLRVGTLGLGGLTLADLLRARASNGASSAKGVILVWLSGGPSHIDMYDMKPEAPPEIRGEFKPITTAVTGTHICELMPLQAKIADQLVFLRGLDTNGSGHRGTILMTGVPEPGKRPTFGSVVSKLRGGSIPPYVSLAGDPRLGEDPAFLGGAHQPFVPAKGPGLQNLGLEKSMTAERVADRKTLLRSLDNLRRDLDGNGELTGVDQFTAQALEIISSTKARDAFDITREPASVQAKYGKASKFLQARRLAEAGVSVVTLDMGGWDTHSDNFKSLRQKLLPELDHAVHALVTDLHERGLDKDVAVVIWGEMGRTPKINGGSRGLGPGRDHWPNAGSALLAGGGLRMGQVLGETDARGGRAKGVPYTPQNVLTMLYHVLGIDPATTLDDNNGRPVHLLDQRDKIAELL
jgi:hypothetical protein